MALGQPTPEERDAMLAEIDRAIFDMEDASEKIHLYISEIQTMGLVGQTRFTDLFVHAVQLVTTPFTNLGETTPGKDLRFLTMRKDCFLFLNTILDQFKSNPAQALVLETALDSFCQRLEQMTGGISPSASPREHLRNYYNALSTIAEITERSENRNLGRGDSNNVAVLSHLKLSQIGPMKSLMGTFGQRLNVFTGDNGLGKSFLLDTIWWMFTNSWADSPVLPRSSNGGGPVEIEYDFEAGTLQKSFIVQYDFFNQCWIRIGSKPSASYVVLYARVDGGFSVWDSYRNSWGTPANQENAQEVWRPPAYHFSRKSLWNGLHTDDGEKTLCNGLINDWITWQFQPPNLNELAPFSLLNRVLQLLSPDALEHIKPGPPVRTALDNVRNIPSLELPYGMVPITIASAAMKRIISFAYLFTWAWSEHLQAAKLLHMEPTSNFILLVDEVESHLHPQWQRVLMPAILDLASCLETDLHSQMFVTTHAPLVMASLEPHFKEDLDRLFLFTLDESGNIHFDNIPWAKQGDVDNWLTSDLFDLKQARSKEAEKAIGAAEAYMRGEIHTLDVSFQTQEQIHQELMRVLPGHDTFWPRWLVTTDQIPKA